MHVRLHLWGGFAAGVFQHELPRTWVEDQRGVLSLPGQSIPTTVDVDCRQGRGSEGVCHAAVDTRYQGGGYR